MASERLPVGRIVGGLPFPIRGARRGHSAGATIERHGPKRIRHAAALAELGATRIRVRVDSPRECAEQPPRMATAG